MLQRSQSIAETSIASVNSNLSHMGYNDDDNSTQFTQTSGIMSQMSNGHISASSSMQEENKSWLESSPQRRFTSGDSSVSSAAAEYVAEGIASTGRRGSGGNTRMTKRVNGSGHDITRKTGVFKMTTKTAHVTGEIHNPRTDTRLFKSEYSQRNLSKQQMSHHHIASDFPGSTKKLMLRRQPGQVSPPTRTCPKCNILQDI